MKIEKAIARLEEFTADAPPVFANVPTGLAAMERSALHTVLQAIIKARKIGSEIYCCCNTTRPMDMILGEMCEALDIKTSLSPSGLLARVRDQHCPIHSPPIGKRQLRRR